MGRIDYPIQLGKKKIIRYAVTESLKVPDSLNEKEVERIIHIIAGGKKIVEFFNRQYMGM